MSSFDPQQHQQLPHQHQQQQQQQHQQHQHQEHQSSLMDAFPSNNGGGGVGGGASFYHAPSAAFANFASMAFASGSGSGHHNMGNGSNDAVAMPFAQLPAHIDAGMAGYEDEEGDEDEEEDDEDDDEEGGGRPDGAAHRGSSSSSSQQGAAAAAAGAGSCFQCPYCEKRYTGKHARSIWRRHLQDKHAIPLSQQPRRTRWDGDMNRPKNAEERRQRMLESKRRWARKKRLAEKGLTAPTTDDDDDDGGGQSAVRPAAPSQSSRRARASSHSVAQAHAHAQAPQLLPPQQSQQQQSQQQAQQQHQQQQPQTQTQTQPMMPAFFEAGGFPTMPLASAAAVAGPRSAWPSAESSLAAARDFGRPHDAVAMMANIASPRQALAQLDGNQGVASSRFIKIKDETRAVYDKQQQQQQHSQQAHTQQSQHQSQHKTPVNRFSQLYPTPPSMGSGSGSGDSLRFSLDGFFSSTPRQHVSGQHQQQQRGKHSQPLLSPPTSTHAESSPSNAKHNPFSLDRHRVSPRAAAAAAASAAATTAASPMRAGLAAHSPVRSNKRGSPTARRLPPLMRTPLFGGGGTSTDASPLALNRAFGGARSRPQRAKVETPTEDHMERMLGFTPIKARQPTPRRKESSERHQVSRAGAGADHPSSDDGSNNNGDSGGSSGGGGGDNEGLPALFSSPAHPNLTQSLGLAPHRSGLASINATPFAKLQPLLGHSLGASSLQWPDSVVRPSMYRRADDDDDGLSLGDDDDDDDDDDDGPPQSGDGSPARKRSRVSSKPAVASSTMTTPRRLGPLASPTSSSSSSSLSSSKWLKLRADDLAASSSADDNGHLAPRPALAERRAN